MLFNLAFLSTLLVVPAVLAVRPYLGTHIARHSEGLWSSVTNPLEDGTSDVSNPVIYTNNWAGAFWAKGNGTFNHVTGTITVPTPSGPEGSGASAWVGLDGFNCTSAILQTGVVMAIQDGEPTYFPWYEWYPDYAQPFSTNITISAGDVLKFTVLAWSANSGMAIIHNYSNGQNVSQSLDSTAPLCGGNAEWIVEDFTQNTTMIPFADFGTVTFWDAEANGPEKSKYTPAGATTLEIKQNGTVLTDVSTDEAGSVTIRYV